MQGTRFRHTAQFRRWRADKRPRDCTFEQLEVVPPHELAAIFEGALAQPSSASAEVIARARAVARIVASATPYSRRSAPAPGSGADRTRRQVRADRAIDDGATRGAAPAHDVAPELRVPHLLAREDPQHLAHRGIARLRDERAEHAGRRRFTYATVDVALDREAHEQRAPPARAAPRGPERRRGHGGLPTVERARDLQAGTRVSRLLERGAMTALDQLDGRARRHQIERELAERGDRFVLLGSHRAPLFGGGLRAGRRRSGSGQTRRFRPRSGRPLLQWMCPISYLTKAIALTTTAMMVMRQPTMKRSPPPPPPAFWGGLLPSPSAPFVSLIGAAYQPSSAFSFATSTSAIFWCVATLG